MKSAVPPTMATWVLTRFAANEALMGDLLEDFERRRSPIWYRRQVISAMFTSVTYALRTHPGEVARTVLLSWGALTLVKRCAAGAGSGAIL
jgi:hypothetical protein